MGTFEQVKANHIRQPQPDLKELHTEMALLTQKQNRLLPSETQLKNWMTERARAIKHEVGEFEASAAAGKPILDPVVLTWRHPLRLKGIPVPKLALINPFNGPTMRFDVETTTSDPVWRHYQDVVDAISNRMGGRRRRTKIRMTFTYDGVIPDDTRDLIYEQSNNFERVLLLVDAPHSVWKYQDAKAERPPRPRYLDPLVLGYTSKGHLVVLGQFDPTPLELYVAAEFSAKQLTAGS